MQKIVTNLWFDTEAEEAVELYTSIFDNSKIKGVQRYGEAGPGPEGSVMVVDFQLEGQDFTAINGGPEFKFNEAISLLVNCETQDEVDELWDKLLAGGGREQQCGWLKDKYGLSWQIVPTILGELLSSGDAERTNSVMKALLGMVKLDVETLKKAYENPQSA
ncbi:MAG: VOC family protein [Actinomycetota bacterium]|nr:VOC family protein [Actinomycetota bacterium]